MDKKIVGLLGAAAALTTLAGAQAAPAPTADPSSAMSYRDLLNPVANALPQLKADDARLARQSAGEETRVAQVSVTLGHHHHHHWRRHHHHHHHRSHHHHHHH